MEIIIGRSPELISKARSIRHQVFVVEQNIPHELDLDGLDDESHHVLVTDGSSLAATARLYVDEVGHSIMARIAVVKEYRGSGIATKVVRALMTYAGDLGVVTIEIHAHEYLRNYYEKFGFKFVCEVEVVGELQLIEMKYQVANIWRNASRRIA